MEKDDIEVVPKKSVRNLSYLGTPILLCLGSLLIWDSSIYSPAIEIPMIILGCIAIIMGVLWLPHIYRFKIKFGPDAVYKYGLYTRQIPYSNIQKLIVNKGFIEMQGNGFFHTISIGDLYTNFEVATKYLSSKIKETESIDYDGKQKYITKYFERSST